MNSEKLFYPPPSSPIPNETEIKLPAAHNRLGTSPSLPVLEPIGLERFFLMSTPNSPFLKQASYRKTGGKAPLGAVKHFGNTGSED